MLLNLCCTETAVLWMLGMQLVAAVVGCSFDLVVADTAN